MATTTTLPDPTDPTTLDNSPQPGATPQPTQQPTGTPSSVASPNAAGTGGSSSSMVGVTPNPDVQNWYRNVAGRDADQGGLQFWSDAVSKNGAAAAYSDFLKSITANEGGYVKPMDMGAASTPYAGRNDADPNSYVDEWARNVFGRAATPQEIAAYSAPTSKDEAGKQFAQFVREGIASGGTAKPLDLLAASQLTSGAPAGPYGGMVGQYLPNLSNQIDPATMTVEGRIANLLATDANGNYTNQTVRQAVDRAMQGYNGRGMLNSSMAQQAGQEAAISKAIEIAQPDAATYFNNSQHNQDATNLFARDQLQQQYQERNQGASFAHDTGMESQRTADQLQIQGQQQQFQAGQTQAEQQFTARQNYQTLLDNANARYTQQVNQINASNMNPEDRSVAIAQAAAARDGDLVYVNRLFSQQPNFQSAWLSAAVSINPATIDQITDPNVVANLANDPAQPQEVRTKAQARLDALRAQGIVPGTPKPAATPAPGMIGEPAAAGG